MSYCGCIDCWQKLELDTSHVVCASCVILYDGKDTDQSDTDCTSESGNEVSLFYWNYLKMFQEWVEVYDKKIECDERGCYLHLETYGGGPSGGYRIRCAGLYRWYQDWATRIGETKVCGILMQRINDDGIFQVRFVDE